MNNKILSAYLPKTYQYKAEDLSLEICFQSNPFDLDPESLFALALRKNRRRRFLFVSKVLGKHIPVNPLLPLLAGAALAVQYAKELLGIEHPCYAAIIQALKTKQQMSEVFETLIKKPLIAPPEKTLFIGFAETATALGHSVFSLFDNACYLHTTREEIPCLKPELDFREEHSHAVNHRCYVMNNADLKTAQTIVFIDDELTTGNTVLNIIQAIHRQYPKKNYVILSLLDWRSAEHRARFKQVESELGTEIQALSLMGGEFKYSDLAKEQNANVNPSWEPQIFGQLSQEEGKPLPEPHFISKYFPFDESELVAVYSQDSSGWLNKTPYLRLTGRFGLSWSNHQKSISLARKIGGKLKLMRQGSKTLCLGTGEFMYFPMLISTYMGEGVSFHSTTRSPIYTIARTDYAVQNGCSFLCPEDPGIINYVYNLPENYYDDVYFFMEREVSRKRLYPLQQIIQAKGIFHAVFVICSSSPERRFLSDPKNPTAANP
ncbi:phosphoribosyltransferase family protein [Desulfosporosinus sp. FKB]|uniref:phosphoribosyltransferase family protein n=1 Tax=Desulfosporosinus sp. FKB TaxID=1969835 RepID=UPI000B4A1570|nr:phosphoribosyltransferase family protein [Desulfosporosinus sp. FKB]